MTAAVDWAAIQIALTTALDNAPEGSTVRVHPSLYLFAQNHIADHQLEITAMANLGATSPQEVEVARRL